MRPSTSARESVAKPAPGAAADKAGAPAAAPSHAGASEPVSPKVASKVASQVASRAASKASDAAPGGAVEGFVDAVAKMPMPSLSVPKVKAADLPKPRMPRLFTTVAMAAACLLMLKGVDLMFGAPLVDRATAQTMLGPEPPVLRRDGANSGQTEIYIESAGRETPDQTPTNPLDTVSTEEVLTERIAERRRLLAERERELDMRESLLKAAEARIEERIGSLRVMERQAEGGTGPDGAPMPDADMDRIVTMYEAMKAKEAARILAELDMEVLEAVARRMNPRKLADVMGAMDAKPATRLTVRLAGSRSAPDTGLKPSVPANLPVIQGEMPR